MKRWIPFKELDKKDKIFWIVNLSFSILMSLVCVVLSFYYGLVYNWNNRLGSAVGMSVASLIPIAFELITRRRLSNTVFLLVNIYILFAGVVGTALNVYYLLWWYDILIHCIMGYAIAMLALFFLCRMGEHNKMKAVTIALFCFCFSLGIELIWEMFERFLDVYLGQTAQGPKIDGTNSPLVADTIEDLLCNFSGAFLFFVHFIVDRYCHVNLGFKYILTDFSGENMKRKYMSQTLNLEKTKPESVDVPVEENNKAEQKPRKKSNVKKE